MIIGESPDKCKIQFRSEGKRRENKEKREETSPPPAWPNRPALSLPGELGYPDAGTEETVCTVAVSSYPHSKTPTGIWHNQQSTQKKE